MTSKRKQASDTAEPAMRSVRRRVSRISLETEHTDEKEAAPQPTAPSDDEEEQKQELTMEDIEDARTHKDKDDDIRSLQDIAQEREWTSLSARPQPGPKQDVKKRKWAPLVPWCQGWRVIKGVSSLLDGSKVLLSLNSVLAGNPVCSKV